MEKNDKECIASCLNGDRDAFRFLVMRYERPLLAYLIYQLKDKSKAQEAAQETFVRAYSNLNNLSKPEAFYSWLIGIASRVKLELFRQQKREEEKINNLQENKREEMPLEIDNNLEEALGVLPENQRKMILLRYYQDYSCQEISKLLNKPLGTITKTLSRAYASLRKELENSNSKAMEVLS